MLISKITSFLLYLFSFLMVWMFISASPTWAAEPPTFKIIFSDKRIVDYPLPEPEADGTYQFSTPDLVASITPLANDQWSLQITTINSAIQKVWFPSEPNGYRLNANFNDDIVYYPIWVGTARLAHTLEAGQWWNPTFFYPGDVFSPLMIVADDTKARIVAATNWPPKRVAPQWSYDRMVLVYDYALNPGDTAEYRVLISEVDGDASIGDHPWQLAADKYKIWLREKTDAEGITPVPYSTWMKKIDGMLAFNLQNMGGFGQEYFDEYLGIFKQYFPWVQFWGQMARPWQPDLPVEGCCGDDKSNQEMREMHPSRIPNLIDIAIDWKTDGSHIGYYERTGHPGTALLSDPAEVLPGENRLQFLTNWQKKNEAEYGANAHYIDILGAVFYGDPEFMIPLFKDEIISRDTVIEYPVDIYPTAFLISGSFSGLPDLWLKSATFENIPKNLTPAYPYVKFPNVGRYIMNDQIVFLGYSNGDYQFWGRDKDYELERQAFLMGAKFECGACFAEPGYVDGKKVLDYAVDTAIRQRDAANWWQRWPRYLDTKGIAQVEPGIHIRRFEDKNDQTLFAIDNWENEKPQISFIFEGKPLTINIPNDPKTDKPYRLYIFYQSQIWLPLILKPSPANRVRY